MGNCCSSPAKEDRGGNYAVDGKQQKTVKQDPSTYNILQKPGRPNIQSVYVVGKVLGKGQFGTTRLATHKETGKQYASKSIAKRQLKLIEDIEDVRTEVQIMYHLEGHKNIIRLVETFEDKHNVHLVMEVASGGELFDRIVAKGHYSEKDAAAACRTILQIVNHCHDMGVIHRDLKPENFLLVDNSEDALLKATDFGLSTFFKPGQEFQDVVGSPFYVAPEVLARQYGHECDIWSAGVILYIMLSGLPPFWGDNEKEIFESIKHGYVDFESDPWPKISKSAKECVSRMLTKDRKKRASAKEILEHEWMRENGVASDQPLDSEVLSRIKKFAAMNKLKKEALKVIAGNLPEEEIRGLKELFVAMDTDKSGNITISELREGLQKKGSAIPPEELEQIMNAADIDGDGQIDYEEFLAATMNMNTAAKLENLESAFRHFDSDGSGYITKDELEQALKKHGHMDGEIEALIEEADKDKDGQIEYFEFVEMMTANLGQESPGLNLRGRLLS